MSDYLGIPDCPKLGRRLAIGIPVWPSDAIYESILLYFDCNIMWQSSCNNLQNSLYCRCNITEDNFI